ncbi:MAG: hypothetical protein JXQ96_01710 [Cyclobacteriaceae bacterium]
MNDLTDISRRSFVTKSLVSGSGLLLAGCLPGLDSKKQHVDSAAIDEIKSQSLYGESPYLTEKVLTEELPLVQERLPKNPFVRTVAQEGVYGGTFYSDTSRQGGHFFFDGSLSTAPQVTDNEGKKIIPHACEKVEISDDRREYTFYLREGLKWSDGIECTADDIIWWWEHEQNNKDLYPAGPSELWKIGDEYAKFTKISKWVFRITFPRSFAALNNVSAHDKMKFSSEFGQPAHYMKQFHLDFNPKANELAQSFGYEKWFMLYKQHENYFRPHGGKPNLGPWYRSESTTTHDIFMRNPYFFEVDQFGNQLPYVDKIFVSVIEDRKLLDSRIATGANTMGRSILSQIFVYNKNKKSGDFNLRNWKLSNSSECMFAFNLNHKNEQKNRIYNDLRFRQALSIAINRNKINEILFFGMAKEWQATVSPEVSFFDPKWAQYCAEYDMDHANELLDELGLEWDSDKRYRLLPDGSRFVTEVIFTQQSYPIQLVEMVAQDWSAVGIETIPREADGLFRREKCMAADHDCTCWNADVIEEIAIYMPWSTKWNPNRALYYAINWWYYYQTGGQRGTKPPDIWMDQFNRMVDWYSATSQEEYERIGYEVWDFFSKQLVTIGTVGYSPLPVVVKNGLMNVQDEMRMGFGLGWAKTYFPQMYFWDEPQKHL